MRVKEEIVIQANTDTKYNDRIKSIEYRQINRVTVNLTLSFDPNLGIASALLPDRPAHTRGGARLIKKTKTRMYYTISIGLK